MATLGADGGLLAAFGNLLAAALDILRLRPYVKLRGDVSERAVSFAFGSGPVHAVWDRKAEVLAYNSGRSRVTVTGLDLARHHVAVGIDEDDPSAGTGRSTSLSSTTSASHIGREAPPSFFSPQCDADHVTTGSRSPRPYSRTTASSCHSPGIPLSA